MEEVTPTSEATVANKAAFIMHDGCMVYVVSDFAGIICVASGKSIMQDGEYLSIPESCQEQRTKLGQE